MKGGENGKKDRDIYKRMGGSSVRLIHCGFELLDDDLLYRGILDDIYEDRGYKVFYKRNNNENSSL